MKLHHSLLALALTSLFAAPALAQTVPDDDDAYLENWTIIHDHVDTEGLVFIYGEIPVSARSGAVVEQSQLTHGSGNYATGENFMNADLGEGALDGATGNIGVNVAAGVGNAQSNDAALSSIISVDDADPGHPESLAEGDDPGVYASAMIFSDQKSDANYATLPNSIVYTEWNASLGDDALAGATGNIGVNVAAGVGNAQSNALAASTNSAGTVAYATSDSAQEAYWNSIETEGGTQHTLNATLGMGALAGATGNLGVNVAAGVGNLQHNSLAIASASSCVTCP
ncbi:hypothetical protein ACFOLC_15100 [Lysobacter cavernae]|uniref:Cell surface protein n=1 Tax=Lysobacter cavernae TaxID=1685901 RepID=A0ABV7RUP3_9GAMM